MEPFSTLFFANLAVPNGATSDGGAIFPINMIKENMLPPSKVCQWSDKGLHNILPILTVCIALTVNPTPTWWLSIAVTCVCCTLTVTLSTTNYRIIPIHQMVLECCSTHNHCYYEPENRNKEAYWEALHKIFLVQWNTAVWTAHRYYIKDLNYWMLMSFNLWYEIICQLLRSLI